MFDTITRCFFACLKGAAGAALKRWLQLSEKNRLRSRAARKVAAPCGSTLSATLNSSNNKNSWLWKNANAWWCPRWPGSARWRVTCCWLTWGREFHSGPEPLTGPSALGKQQCSLSLDVFWPPVFVFNYPPLLSHVLLLTNCTKTKIQCCGSGSVRIRIGLPDPN